MFKSGLSSQSAGDSFASLVDFAEEDGVFSDEVDCEDIEGSMPACRMLVENRDWPIGLLVGLIR